LKKQQINKKTRKPKRLKLQIFNNKVYIGINIPEALPLLKQTIDCFNKTQKKNVGWEVAHLSPKGEPFEQPLNFVAPFPVSSFQKWSKENKNSSIFDYYKHLLETECPSSENPPGEDSEHLIETQHFWTTVWWHPMEFNHTPIDGHTSPVQTKEGGQEPDSGLICDTSAVKQPTDFRASVFKKNVIELPTVTLSINSMENSNFYIINGPFLTVEQIQLLIAGGDQEVRQALKQSLKLSIEQLIRNSDRT
jgi:hypothetical protein